GPSGVALPPSAVHHRLRRRRQLRDSQGQGRGALAGGAPSLARAGDNLVGDLLRAHPTARSFTAPLSYPTSPSPAPPGARRHYRSADGPPDAPGPAPRPHDSTAAPSR